MPIPDQAGEDGSSTELVPIPKSGPEAEVKSTVVAIAEPVGTEVETSALHQTQENDAGHDDIVAALTAMTPADMNIDLMLDHLTTSSDLFASPHLDLSALGHGGDGDHS